MIASAADTITAIGAAIGAVLAGAAAVIAALARREGRETSRKVETGNGQTLGQAVTRIQRELAEARPLLEWARLRRASELLGIDRPTAEDVHRAESELHRALDEGGGRRRGEQMPGDAQS